MKNLTYIIMSLCFIALSSCGMTDVWKNWESEGIQNPDRLKPSEVKSVLCAAEGWKLNYLGHDFYFQFFEDGTVIANSDTSIEEATTYTSCHFNTQGDHLIALTIDGGGHLSALPESLSESTYLISAVTDSRISCIGENTGVDMSMVSVTMDELNAQLKAKANLLMLLNMKKKGFMNGVVRNADGTFAAHYAISSSESKIRFISIEDRIAVHQEADFIIDGSSFSFSGITLAGQNVTKLTYSNTGEGSAKLEGTYGLKITSNKDITTYFEGSSYTTYEISKSKGDAKKELREELSWSSISTVEINNRLGRPVVVCLNGANGYGGYIFYWAGQEGQSATFTKNELDRVYFDIFLTQGLWGGTEQGINATNQALSKFLAAWFHPDGLYMVEEIVGSKNYIYFLSPTTDNWFKIER